MKHKINSYDLDDIGFVGGGRPLTEEDTKAISAYIQSQKKKQAKKKPRITTRSKKTS